MTIWQPTIGEWERSDSGEWLSIPMSTDPVSPSSVETSSQSASLEASEIISNVISETRSNDAEISSTDDLQPSIDAALEIKFKASDTFTLSLIESVFLAKGIFSSDTLTTSFTESRNPLKVLKDQDLVINLTESPSLSTTFKRTDGLSVNLDDSVKIIISSSSDTLTVSLGESSYAVEKADVTSSDTLSISLTESSVGNITSNLLVTESLNPTVIHSNKWISLSHFETLTPTLDRDSWIIISRTDSAIPSLTGSLVVRPLVVTGDVLNPELLRSNKNISLSSSESLSTGLLESPLITASLFTAETIIIPLSELVGIDANLSSLESLLPGLSETAGTQTLISSSETLIPSLSFTSNYFLSGLTLYYYSGGEWKISSPRNIFVLKDSVWQDATLKGYKSEEWVE